MRYEGLEYRINLDTISEILLEKSTLSHERSLVEGGVRVGPYLLIDIQSLG